MRGGLAILALRRDIANRRGSHRVLQYPLHASLVLHENMMALRIEVLHSSNILGSAHQWHRIPLSTLL